MKLTRISVALGALILTFGLAGTAFATHVTPEPISNDANPTCGDFGAWTEAIHFVHQLLQPGDIRVGFAALGQEVDILDHDHRRL